MRGVAYALLILGASGLLLFSYIARPPAPELPDHMIVEVASFDDLPGWGAQRPQSILSALDRGCLRFFGLRGNDWEDPDDSQAFRQFFELPFQEVSIGGDSGLYGFLNEWGQACLELEGAEFGLSHTRLTPDTMITGDQAAALLLEGAEQKFTPIRIRNNSETTGMFTGYYEPELQGSRTETAEFSTPLLTRPDDLVIVQLGDFPGDHDGRIAGRVVDGNLHPFESRTEIEAGALANAQPLAWVRPVDAFFLQIQGSGRVVFEDGAVLRAGYDGVNGHPYTAIGRTLIRQGALTLENVSMQSIRDWLEQNPDGAGEVMRTNASYVFFREVEVDDPELGPIGAAGVPLTPGYSLAVDARYHAYGAPIYIATTLPDGTPFNRLMVAQDTGGAIRGPIRGDIFFGYGDEAGAVAGRMRNQGEMWVLVPNAIADRLLAEQAAQESE